MNSVEKSNILDRKLDVNFQFKPLAICPLPPRAAVIKYIDLKDGKKKKAYESEFDRDYGPITLKIIGSKKFGLPHGRDVLVILYLIREALRQNNNGIIETRSPIKDFLDMFGIASTKQSYVESKKRFLRIRYSSWYWKENNDNVEHSETFHIIKRWNVYFDLEDQHSLFDSFIELSPEFWSYIRNKKIPYDLNSIRKIKDKPLLINLYLWLVYRVYEIWIKKETKPVFIPFFSEKGLMKQLGSGLKNNRDFKKKMVDYYLPMIKEIWPNCPVKIEQEFETARNRLKWKKTLKDGLTIKVTSVDQLQVAPHWPKMFRQAREESENNKKKQ